VKCEEKRKKRYNKDISRGVKYGKRKYRMN